jgi:GNAT superfamily N-acetyltransferase
MQEIKKIDARLLASSSKACRRADMSFAAPYFEERRLIEETSEGRAYLLKDGSRVISVASFSFFPMEEICPLNPSKQNDILDQIGYFGEPLLLLSSIFTDPSYEGKGYGRSLFLSLCFKHKDATWFALLPSERLRLLPFFKKLGFVPFDYNEAGNLILIRKKVKEGLCANPSF